MTQLPLHMICSPVGSGGNHLRWLLFLDSRYHLTLEGIPLSSINDKVNFIVQYVYPDHRTWNNWLAFEFRYHEQLNYYLKYTHNYSDFYDGLKTVGMKITPEIAFNHYYKFNPGISHSKETFGKQIHRENWISQLLNKEFEHFTLIDADKLFFPVLDQEIYYNVINFLELEDHYETAQKIHTKWFDLNRKAEIQIMKDLQTIYQQ